MISEIRLAWRNQSRRFGAPGLVLRFSGTLHPRITTLPRLPGRFLSTSNSPTSTPSTDIEPTLYPQAELVETSHARNTRFREAFRARPTEEELGNTISSPFVPPARTYPSATATKKSKKQARDMARVQLAFGDVWAHFQTKVPEWRETLNLLKKMTPKRNEVPNMAAVRIVLPKSWDLTMDSMKLEFVDSATGLAAKLRASADQRNPHAIVLRGKSSVLAKAADELVAACKDVEIFQLGDLETLDYEAKRLWPAIEDAPDGGTTLPVDNPDSIWIHRELTTYWIETSYEQTPKPVEWTKESFQSYILSVACGRLRPHLALLLYGENRRDGKLVDTEGIRVRLISEAFEDPSARASITPSILKTAVAFMAHRGGHRSAANRLFTLAEEWGIPMDAELFNVMLDGYVAKRDVTYFHKFLLKMEKRYFHPNARTWLLFLKLLQQDGERRQTIVAMYELGLFEDPATRRGIAEIMASHDAYAAFKAGKTLDAFMADQAALYGEDWLTTTALNHMLREYISFYPDEDRKRFSEFKTFLEKQLEDGRKLDISTVHVVLQRCAEGKDWATALWMVSLLHRQGLEPSHEVYKHIITLAFHARSRTSLGVALFYGIVERKLRGHDRSMARRILLGQTSHPFWNLNKPRLFSKEIASVLRKHKAASPYTALAAVEWAVLSACGDHVPVKSLGESLKVAFRTMDQPMHQQLKDPRRKPEDVRVATMVVKMRGPKEEGSKMVVRLDGRFVPESMVENWGSGAVADDVAEEEYDGSGEWDDAPVEESVPDELLRDDVPDEQQHGVELSSPATNNRSTDVDANADADADDNNTHDKHDGKEPSTEKKSRFET